MKTRRENQSANMPRRVVKHCPECCIPECASDGKGRSAAARSAPIELRIPRQARIRIDTVLFEGDEVRAYIAFLEDPSFQIQLVGHFARDHVNGPTITEQDNGVHLAARCAVPHRIAPLLNEGAESELRVRMEEEFAAVKIDLQNIARSCMP